MQTDATKLWCIASHRFADAILIHCIEESDASDAMRGRASLLRCDAIKARYDAIPMHASHQFHPELGNFAEIKSGYPDISGYPDAKRPSLLSSHSSYLPSIFSKATS
ncbi:hypothetical protein PGT21_005298 [Puccinia graminis f. sp. tritici]|uniref:Uncharacterized protein n=1 Tax=Puccinia graminis f. sp. tritici TaxID=56615 RepID=A0A5B0MCP7_PUCGR|nr:hypothetical protein PGT21_005298 [Puccinia graminis f. sp. tritici]